MDGRFGQTTGVASLVVGWRAEMSRRVHSELRRRGRDVQEFPHRASLPGLLKKAIDRTAIDLVVDIGAFHGWYVDMLRDEVGYAGRVVSYEPNPAALAVLQNRAVSDPVWEVRPVALGAEPGTATLQVYENGPLSSLHDPSPYSLATWNFDSARPVEVEVSTLAAELPELKATSFLVKIDTQGHDLAVLEGGGDFDRVRLVQMEVPQVALYEGVPTLHEFLETVAGYGFELVGLVPSLTEDQGQHSDNDLRVIEFDGLFYKR